ncbi:hypothetical protein AD947_00910 [Acetobacter tropicalis]|uniref:Uncharacterized protein n=1 Tax=Acetobacter tropicalis TaxID=104102 RepID=A0A149U792_9PROT|nr:hypothetical protein AD947_00910 [Acetobacter tropicalis]
MGLPSRGPGDGGDRLPPFRPVPLLYTRYNKGLAREKCKNSPEKFPFSTKKPLAKNRIKAPAFRSTCQRQGERQRSDAFRPDTFRSAGNAAQV